MAKSTTLPTANQLAAFAYGLQFWSVQVALINVPFLFCICVLAIVKIKTVDACLELTSEAQL